MRPIFLILHLIAEDAEGFATVSDQSRQSGALHVCAELLAVDPDALLFALTNRQIQTGSRASIATKHLDVDSSNVVRDTLAKSLYVGLFHEIIRIINLAMAPQSKAPLSIGTLDIFGFEILSINSLEQFMINYVNEKLQGLFIDRILRAQQVSLYAHEALVPPPSTLHTRSQHKTTVCASH